jgi:hypothetical protein
MRGGSVMTGGSAERLVYVSVSRFVGMARGYWERDGGRLELIKLKCGDIQERDHESVEG